MGDVGGRGVGVGTGTTGGGRGGGCIVTTAAGVELQAGHGGQLGAEDMTGDADGIVSAVIVAEPGGATRAAFAVDGGPHLALSQTRSPLQSLSF